VSAHRLSSREILSLPATMNLATLARCLGKSEPVVRKAHREGELAALGIKVNRLGSNYVVVTASVWNYLGLTPASSARMDHAAAGAA
jgi:hypothetical protein